MCGPGGYVEIIFFFILRLDIVNDTILILCFFAGCLISTLNFYLSFLRYFVIVKLLNKDENSYRHISGFPLIGQLLISISSAYSAYNSTFFWIGLIFILIDTGGIHFFVIAIVGDYLNTSNEISQLRCLVCNSLFGKSCKKTKAKTIWVRDHNNLSNVSYGEKVGLSFSDLDCPQCGETHRYRYAGVGKLMLITKWTEENATEDWA